jgi:hypothetical protein
VTVETHPMYSRRFTVNICHGEITPRIALSGIEESSATGADNCDQ